MWALPFTDWVNHLTFVNICFFTYKMILCRSQLLWETKHPMCVCVDHRCAHKKSMGLACRFPFLCEDGMPLPRELGRERELGGA